MAADAGKSRVEQTDQSTWVGSNRCDFPRFWYTYFRFDVCKMAKSVVGFSASLWLFGYALVVPIAGNVRTRLVTLSQLYNGTERDGPTAKHCVLKPQAIFRSRSMPSRPLSSTEMPLTAACIRVACISSIEPVKRSTCTTRNPNNSTVHSWVGATALYRRRLVTSYCYSFADDVQVRFIVPLQDPVGAYAVGTGRELSLYTWMNDSTIAVFQATIPIADPGDAISTGKCDLNGRLLVG